MFEVKNKNTRTVSMTSIVLVLLLLASELFLVFLLDVEQVNLSWEEEATSVGPRRIIAVSIAC